MNLKNLIYKELKLSPAEQKQYDTNIIITKNNTIIITNIKEENNPNLIIAHTLYNCKNTKIKDNIQCIKSKKLDRLFYLHNFKKKPINLDILQLRQVRSTIGMFTESNFTPDVNINNWDMSYIHIMENMFYEATNLSCNLSLWELHNVYIINGCFSNTPNNKCIFGSWDFKKLRYMEKTFLQTNINFNFNTWKLYDNSIEANNMIAYNNKQTNQFQTWNFKFINTDNYIFKNCHNIQANSKNFYKANSFFHLVPFMKHNNLIYNMEKYVVKNKKKELEKAISFHIQLPTKYIKYRKEYTQYKKKLKNYEKHK